MSDREAFEAWAMQRGYDVRYAVHNYASMMTAVAWGIWQGATQAREPEIEELRHDIERSLATSSELATENERLRERVAELEAAG